MPRMSFIAPLNRFAFVALLAAGLTMTGCDSNGDDGDNGDGDSDAEVLVGEWSATSVMAGPIDVLAILGLDLTLMLEENGTGTILAVDEDGTETELSGMYEVDDVGKTVTLSGEELDGDLVIGYEIVTPDMLTVEVDADDLEDLGFDLGTIGGLLSGVPITVELTRVNG